MAGRLDSKYCHIARCFGNNEAEARRQLKVWKKDVGQGVGLGWTVHLRKNPVKGWCIVLCTPDYKPHRKRAVGGKG